MGVQARLRQDCFAQCGRIQVSVKVSDERQVLLAADEDERARAVEIVCVCVEQACARHVMQVTPGWIPGIRGVDQEISTRVSTGTI
jgi:hypothetical protein